jgi:hypothetical protein
MNWINFVKEHPGSLHFQRIGRCVYSYAPKTQSNTINLWVRNTDRQILMSN